MHIAVLRTKGKGGFFFDWQCIHIGTQQKDFAALFAVYKGANTGFAAIGGRYADTIKLAFDYGNGIC